jgi:hypothetical protein
MRGDAPPDVALLVPVLPGCAHERGREDHGEFAAVTAARLGEVGQDMTAVGVEEPVSNGHCLVSAERAGFRLVNGLDRADSLFHEFAAQAADEGCGPAALPGGWEQAQPPAGSLPGKPPGGQRSGVFGGGQPWADVDGPGDLGGLPVVAPQADLPPAAAGHSRSSRGFLLAGYEMSRHDSQPVPGGLVTVCNVRATPAVPSIRPG